MFDSHSSGIRINHVVTVRQDSTSWCLVHGIDFLRSINQYTLVCLCWRKRPEKELCIALFLLYVHLFPEPFCLTINNRKSDLQYIRSTADSSVTYSNPRGLLEDLDVLQHDHLLTAGLRAGALGRHAFQTLKPAKLTCHTHYTGAGSLHLETRGSRTQDALLVCILLLSPFFNLCEPSGHMTQRFTTNHRCVYPQFDPIQKPTKSIYF